MFSLCTPWRGGTHVWLIGGTPILPDRGTPLLLDWGAPSRSGPRSGWGHPLVRTGWGFPPAETGWRSPPPLLGMDGGTPYQHFSLSFSQLPFSITHFQRNKRESKRRQAWKCLLAIIYLEQFNCVWG